MVSLTIMNHTFELQCASEEQASLVAAAQTLQAKLNEMPASMPNERKVLLVALNICYDYLTLKDESLKNSEGIEQKINQLLQLLQSTNLDNLSIVNPQNPL